MAISPGHLICCVDRRLDLKRQNFCDKFSRQRRQISLLLFDHQTLGRWTLDRWSFLLFTYQTLFINPLNRSSIFLPFQCPIYSNPTQDKSQEIQYQQSPTHTFNITSFWSFDFIKPLIRKKEQDPNGSFLDFNDRDYSISPLSLPTILTIFPPITQNRLTACGFPFWWFPVSGFPFLLLCNHHNHVSHYSILHDIIILHFISSRLLRFLCSSTF